MQIKPIVQRVRGEEMMEGAGVRVKRFIATRALPEIDPFLLLDEFKSDDSRDFIAGFPPHPHRGFETVTYMLRGRSRHKDSTGAEGLLQPGDVQWMTAGQGVVHSEMPEAADGEIWGYQLWVNLPAAQKMIAPRYQDIPSNTIPEVTFHGGHVRVIAGQFDGVQGAAESLTGITYLDVTLSAGARFIYGLEATANTLVLPIEGALSADDSDEPLTPRQLVQLGSGDGVGFTAAEPSRFLLISGKPLGEPVARGGPFVMNTREEIVQAFQDYQNGRL
jgi:hypothetical protein